MSLARLRVLVSGGLGALLLAVGAGVAEAQTGSITGKVTGADAAGGLEGARVTIVGTNQSTFTNREGVYTVRAVAAGNVQVRVVRLGYDQSTKTITVSAGQAVTLDFQLTSSPFTLSELVTTATGEQRKAELGNVVNVIQTDKLAEEAPLKNMSELINSRAPGVVVMQSAGTTGAGTRVRIRGSNSVSLSNEPLYIVDGIRVESSQASSSIGVGGQSPSRINDINPDEIASIEIVKGPSAAALYGTSAANGVILITTKRGTAGRSRWSVYSEQTAIDDDNDYVDNFSGISSTNPNGVCRLTQVAVGTCQITSIVSFNPFTDPVESPLATGYRRQYGANVSGGSEQAQYFFSAEQELETGVFKMPDAEQARIKAEQFLTRIPNDQLTPNKLRKTNLRANITTQISPKVNVNVSAGYVDSKLVLPENDNNVLGILSSGLNGRGAPNIGPGLWGFFRPGETFQLVTEQRVRRLTLSGQSSYSPTTWLTGRAIVGVDYTNRGDRDLQQNGQGADFSNLRSGFADLNFRNILQYSVDLSSTATLQLNDDINSKTTVGAQWFKNSFRGNDAGGQDGLPPGSKTINSAVTATSSETTVESVTLGSFIEQQFGYKERVFVTGAVRADRNSAVGQNFGVKYYPKASISYLISDEGFFPTGSFLSSLRLRGSYGESGLQPGTTAALEFLSTRGGTSVNGDESGLVLGSFGNPDLKPETSREFEAGFDLTLVDSRIALEGTYFNKKSRDALINVPTPPSAGSPGAIFQNIGAVKNEGIEVTLNAQVLTGRTVALDATLTGSFTRNRLTSLGGQPPIDLNGTTQRAVVGKPLGGYWARPFTFNDVNGDGIIVGSDLTIGSQLEFQGSSQPTRELTLATGLSLLNNKIRLSAQADYRGGNRLWNLNEDFRCRSSRNCRGNYDINVGLAEQARLVANDGGDLAASGQSALLTNFGFLENDKFFKLRELSLTLNAPDSWLRSLRVDRIGLTLSARNIWTETSYGGLDPELNGQGQGNFAVREFLTQPPPKQYTARLNIGF